jgi:hypothetical protein
LVVGDSKESKTHTTNRQTRTLELKAMNGVRSGTRPPCDCGTAATDVLFHPTLQHVSTRQIRVWCVQTWVQESASGKWTLQGAAMLSLAAHDFPNHDFLAQVLHSDG